MELMRKYDASLQPYIENCSKGITFPMLEKDNGGSLTIKGDLWALQVCTPPGSLAVPDILYGAELSSRFAGMAYSVSSFVQGSVKRGLWDIGSLFLIPPTIYTAPTTLSEKASPSITQRFATDYNAPNIGESPYGQ